MKSDIWQRLRLAVIPKEKDRMKRTICIGLLILLGLVGCDDTPLTDLKLHSLEVTQRARGGGRTPVLLSERLTTVRAVLTSDSSYDVTGVMGWLSVAVDGVIMATDIAAINGAITVPSGGKGSLHFVLKAPTGISASRDVDFFVTLSAPGQFLQGEAFDLTFDAPIIAAATPLVREASRLSPRPHSRNNVP